MKLFTQSLTRSSIVCMAIVSLLLLLIWHASTPVTSGPVGILAVFILLYVFFTSLMLVVTGLWSIARVRVFDRAATNVRRRYYVSSVIGFLPVLYLTLLSMGGATVWGVVLICLFTGLMLFYVLRRSGV